jgi:DNA-binding XRE family transcriptional regulator
MTDPRTPAEWQAAVDVADYVLLLDSAIQYGLIAVVGGGPGGVDADRCQDILHRGAQQGIFPTELAARRRAVARWLMRERAALGLTQRALAATCGLSQARISYIEAGRHFTSDEALALLRAGLETIRKEKTT